MENNRNTGALIGGIILIFLGALALAGQLFTGFNFWNNFWPLIIVAGGALFFVGMAAGGKSAAPLAIPGSIITLIGLMMFVQNATNHWESWSYGWTVILFAVGLGIYIMGRYGEREEQTQSGIRLMKLGVFMFIVFGAFFELIFSSSRLAELAFPIGLILLGGYLVLSRSGMLGKGKDSA